MKLSLANRDRVQTVSHIEGVSPLPHQTKPFLLVQWGIVHNSMNE